MANFLTIKTKKIVMIRHLVENVSETSKYFLERLRYDTQMLKYICKCLRGVKVLLRTLVTRQSTSASVREAPKYF